MSDYYYSTADLEAIKILEDFLPDKVFDAHMHLSLSSFAKNVGMGEGRKPNSTIEDYYSDMSPVFGNRYIRANIISEPDSCYVQNRQFRSESTSFLHANLANHPENVGEIVVMPTDDETSLEKELTHPNIIGFKCYHTLMNRTNTWQADIGDYLPECAWQIADRKGLSITLHMVKDKALADRNNLRYIKEKSNQYPNATLILAHAARSFASWTAIETVEELSSNENVWFDFSAVCESPAMIQIINKIGIDRCMWGSDYSCNMLLGKAISLADSFYWIYDRDLENFIGRTEFRSWLIGIENLMAVRQACIITNQKNSDIEKLFYGNAARLFDGSKRK